MALKFLGQAGRYMFGKGTTANTDARTANRRTRNLKPLLRIIGAKVTSSAQSSFDEQRLVQPRLIDRTQFSGFVGALLGVGRGQWPARYPNQTGSPKVNVAGLVEDLKKGAPKSRRFEDRPAGIDRGRLRNSIKPRVTGSRTVEVGSSVDYASTIQFGGTSVTDVPSDNPQFRKRLNKLFKGRKRFQDRRTDRLQAQLDKLKTRSKRVKSDEDRLKQRVKDGSVSKEQAKAKRVKFRSRRATIKEQRDDLTAKKKGIEKGNKEALRKRIGYLFSIDTLETNVVPRPFLPQVKDLEKDVAVMVAKYMRGEIG